MLLEALASGTRLERNERARKQVGQMQKERVFSPWKHVQYSPLLEPFMQPDSQLQTRETILPKFTRVPRRKHCNGIQGAQPFYLQMLPPT